MQQHTTNSARMTVGLDVGDRYSYLCVVDAAGVVVEEGRIPTTRAANRDVVVLGGAAIIQQCIRAGLLDELQLHLVHILLGGGTSLFGGWTRPASRSSARG